jgi:hypothetical protein
MHGKTQASTFIFYPRRTQLSWGKPYGRMAWMRMAPDYCCKRVSYDATIDAKTPESLTIGIGSQRKQSSHYLDACS